MSLPRGFLDVRQVALELRMTEEAAYDLIRGGGLKAVRRSDREVYVSRLALAAYRRRLDGYGPNSTRPRSGYSLEQLGQMFENHTGLPPEQWLAEWKQRDQTDQPADVAQLAVQAIAIDSSL